MNFIELLNYLQPYFRSVRKIKQFFSIDLLFPQTWKFPNEILEKVKAVQDEKYTGPGIAMSFLLDLTTEQEEPQLEKIFELITPSNINSVSLKSKFICWVSLKHHFLLKN